MSLFLTSNKMWFLVYYLPTFSDDVTLFTVFFFFEGFPKSFLDYLHNFRNNTCNSCNSPQTKTPICKVCKIDTKCNQYLLNCYLCNLSKIHVLGFRKWIYSRHINMECQRRCSSKSQFNIRRIRFSYINQMFKLWYLNLISLCISYYRKVQSCI